MNILEYEEQQKLYLKVLNNNTTGVLATSYNDYVTTRTMYYKVIDECIYLLTHRDYFKNEQIRNNPNVSFTVANINLEGKIEISQYNNISEKSFDLLLSSNYLRFSKDDNLILYKMTPEIIKIWNKDIGNAKRTFLYPRIKLVSYKTISQQGE